MGRKEYRIRTNTLNIKDNLGTPKNTFLSFTQLSHKVLRRGVPLENKINEYKKLALRAKNYKKSVLEEREENNLFLTNVNALEKKKKKKKKIKKKFFKKKKKKKIFFKKMKMIKKKKKKRKKICH